MADVASQLVVYESGVQPGPHIGPILTNGTVICLNNYSPGINIFCEADTDATYADFYVNGVHVHQEQEKPFFMAGSNHINKDVYRWTDIPHKANITCKLNSGTSISAQVTFSCQGNTQSQPSGVTDMSIEPAAMDLVAEMPPIIPTSDDAVMPSTMVFREAGSGSGEGPILKDGVTFCPKTFGFNRFSVFCKESALSISAEFLVNGNPVRVERSTPYYIKGDQENTVNAWTDYPADWFVVECRLSDGTSSKASVRVFCDIPLDEGVVKGEEIFPTSEGCVLIDAKSAPVVGDWRETDNGVIFRPGDFAITISVDKKAQKMSYFFTPPVTSRYAVVMDMTTAGGKDYNDIWMRFPEGGFALTRGGVRLEGVGEGWIKGYHNANGRAAIISSVDHNAHSVSTREILEAGHEYEIAISGRSSMVEMHRIVLFPCAGDDSCQRGAKSWKNWINVCVGDL